MALPATDDFTTGSDQNLTARANWTAAENDLKNEADSNDVHSTLGSENGVYWDADVFDAEQYSQGTINASQNNNWIGVAVRASATNFYGAYFDNNDEYMFKVVSGNWTQLDNTSNGVSATDVVYLEASGTDPSNLDAKINDSSVMTDNADGALDSGSAGLCGYGSGPNGRIDDWEGGNLGAARRIFITAS